MGQKKKSEKAWRLTVCDEPTTANTVFSSWPFNV